MDKTQLIDKLFSVGAHFGYAPSRRHPSVAPYIFGAKGGTELFDLEQTAALFEDALNYIKSLAAEKKTILFVGGKAEAKEAVKRAAARLNMPYSAGRWIGGSLTNFNEIKKRLAKLEEHTTMREKGELAKFTKHERLLIDREITNLEEMFGGLKGLTRTPDALLIVDPRHEEGAVAEAKTMGVPVVALMNSDCDRTNVAYPIPANDSAVATITLILDEVTKMYASNTPIAPATPVSTP